MSGCSVVVLKFGSSVLRHRGDLARAVVEIAAHLTRGWRVVAVVSAIGNGTEELVDRTRDPNADGGSPDWPTHASGSGPAAFAALLATGEAASAALLALALDRNGIESTVLDVARVGPFTRGPQLDAMPHALDTHLVRRALSDRPVAILPGFVGRDGDGHCTLLGRGGSDLSALFAAHALRADRCRLLKDVDGIYEHDPALSGLGKPRRFATLDWDGALRLEDCILQRKAVQFACRQRLPFEVGACGDGDGTLVGAAESRFATGNRGDRSTGHSADAPAACRRAHGSKAPASACLALAAEGELAS